MALLLETGKTHVNRTSDFLTHTLTPYGASFLKTIRYNKEVDLLAMCYRDIIYEKVKSREPRLLYLLYDINGHYDSKANLYVNITEGRKYFNALLKYIRNHRTYVDDYIYEYNSNRHMIVIKVGNESYDTVFEHFEKGHYSKMFPEALQQELKITRREHPTLMKIINKEWTPELIKDYKARVAKRFGIEEDLVQLGEELLLPPISIDEIFRFNYEV